MKKLLPLLSFTAVCIIGTASAYAQPVGTFICNGIPQFNVSSYSLGISQPVIPTRSGQSNTPPILTQLSLTASIVEYGTFTLLIETGKIQQNCALTVTGNDDAYVKITFRDVQVMSAQLSAAGPAKKNEEKAAFTAITLSYAAVSVETYGGGNDGGTCPWNQVCVIPAPPIVSPITAPS